MWTGQQNCSQQKEHIPADIKPVDQGWPDKWSCGNSVCHHLCRWRETTGTASRDYRHISGLQGTLLSTRYCKCCANSASLPWMVLQQDSLLKNHAAHHTGLCHHHSQATGSNVCQIDPQSWKLWICLWPSPCGCNTNDILWGPCLRSVSKLFQVWAGKQMQGTEVETEGGEENGGFGDGNIGQVLLGVGKLTRHWLTNRWNFITSAIHASGGGWPYGQTYIILAHPIQWGRPASRKQYNAGCQLGHWRSSQQLHYWQFFNTHPL